MSALLGVVLALTAGIFALALVCALGIVGLYRYILGRACIRRRLNEIGGRSALTGGG